jgi:hypothetical protein
MDNLIFNISTIDERVVITITDNDHNHKGILYFERVKVGFNRKPISMNSWACVDAKVEGLYEVENITPIEVMNKCQEIIRGAGL